MPIPVYYAPLQGFTEDAYRKSHHDICGGITEYYTPFLRLEHGEIRKKDNLGVRPEFNIGIPLVIQVIARDAKELEGLLQGILVHQNAWKAKKETARQQGDLAFSSQLSWPDADRVKVDINMGCPFPLQADHGRGAGLLACPEKIEEICDVIAHHPEYDFSVKMRLGVQEPNEWRQVLPLLNTVPLRHITLHPRVAKQMYKGICNLDEFQAFADVCKHPLVYNGDILSVFDIQRIEQQFPRLKAVMIGRGLLARPTLAQEYISGIAADDREVVSRILELHESLYHNYASTIPGENQLLNKLKPFWEFSEQIIGRKAWKKILKAGNMRNYLLAIHELL